MSLFVCDNCNCIENTATSFYWLKKDGEPALCSECDPAIGRWHGRFEKRVWDGEEVLNRSGRD